MGFNDVNVSISRIKCTRELSQTLKRIYDNTLFCLQYRFKGAVIVSNHSVSMHFSFWKGTRECNIESVCIQAHQTSTTWLWESTDEKTMDVTTMLHSFHVRNPRKQKHGVLGTHDSLPKSLVARFYAGMEITCWCFGLLQVCCQKNCIRGFSLSC